MSSRFFFWPLLEIIMPFCQPHQNTFLITFTLKIKISLKQTHFSGQQFFLVIWEKFVFVGLITHAPIPPCVPSRLFQLIPSDIGGFSIHLASVEPVLDTTAGRTLNQGIIKLAMQVYTHSQISIYVYLTDSVFLPHLSLEKEKKYCLRIVNLIVD